MSPLPSCGHPAIAAHCCPHPGLWKGLPALLPPPIKRTGIQALDKCPLEPPSQGLPWSEATQPELPWAAFPPSGPPLLRRELWKSPAGVSPQTPHTLNGFSVSTHPVLSSLRPEHSCPVSSPTSDPFLVTHEHDARNSSSPARPGRTFRPGTPWGWSSGRITTTGLLRSGPPGSCSVPSRGNHTHTFWTRTAPPGTRQGAGHSFPPLAACE